MPILMAHVVVDKDITMEDAATILTQLQDCLREHFPVSVPHTTFQLEPEGYSSPPPTNSTNKKCSQREHSAGYKKSLYVCDFRAAQVEGLQR